MRDITAIGEILIDLTQTGKNQQQVPVFAANPGGAPANVAVAAARLGCRTAFIGKVGSDGFGAYLRGVLEENGVDHAGLQVGESPTTMAIVSVDGAGELVQWLRALTIKIYSPAFGNMPLVLDDFLH